eukprot:m.479980 g.479980  ORF g.479980 m.479980 type:complete len:133 (-) comp51376_c0_seq1:1301-1699(-)
MRDVAALSAYVLGANATRSAILGQIGLVALDVNLDAVINSADLALLLQELLGLAPTLQHVAVTPLDRSTGCFMHLVASVVLNSGTYGPMPVSDTDYRIFFVLEKAGVSLTQVSRFDVCIRLSPLTVLSHCSP